MQKTLILEEGHLFILECRLLPKKAKIELQANLEDSCYSDEWWTGGLVMG